MSRRLWRETSVSTLVKSIFTFPGGNRRGLIRGNERLWNPVSPLYTHGRGAQLLRKFVLGLLCKLCSRGGQAGSSHGREELNRWEDRDRDRDEWCLLLDWKVGLKCWKVKIE